MNTIRPPFWNMSPFGGLPDDGGQKNSDSSHHLSRSWVHWTSIIALILVFFFSAMVFHAAKGASSWITDNHRDQLQALTTSSNLAGDGFVSTENSMRTISSLEDLDGIPCRRGSEQPGKVQVTYDYKTGEIHIWCNPLILRASSRVQPWSTEKGISLQLP